MIISLANLLIRDYMFTSCYVTNKNECSKLTLTLNVILSFMLFIYIQISAYKNLLLFQHRNFISIYFLIDMPQR